MLKRKEDYDPIKVEAAIDDAYSISEQLDEYSEEVTKVIEEFEKMPYSVNRDGNYEQDELIDSVQALNQLENLYHAANEDAESISQIETLLTEEAFKPSRNFGILLGGH